MIEKHYYAHGVLDIEATLDVIINHLNALEEKPEEVTNDLLNALEK